LFANTFLPGESSNNPLPTFQFGGNHIPIITSPSSLKNGGFTSLIGGGSIPLSNLHMGSILSGAFPPYTRFHQNQPIYFVSGNPSLSFSGNSGFNVNQIIGPNTNNLGDFSQFRLPFMAMLNLPDFMNITNDLVQHLLDWPSVPSMLPSDIPKFEGKSGEDPTYHVMTFHLWCSSNSLMDDSICLRLF